MTLVTIKRAVAYVCACLAFLLFVSASGPLGFAVCMLIVLALAVIAVMYVLAG